MFESKSIRMLISCLSNQFLLMFKEQILTFYFRFVEAVQMESKMRKLAKHGKRDEAVQLAREVRSTVLSLLDSDSSRELLVCFTFRQFIHHI